VTSTDGTSTDGTETDGTGTDGTGTERAGTEGIRGRVGVFPDPGSGRGADHRAMTIRPVQRQVPVGPVLVAGVAAQLADDALYFLLPPTAALSPLSGVVAILLTAVAARLVTRDRVGSGIARTGLAVGALSAGIGLLLSGLGLVAVLLAGITVVAGVAGAVAGRGVTGQNRP
jgi:hypothetical protein